MIIASVASIILTMGIGRAAGNPEVSPAYAVIPVQLSMRTIPPSAPPKGKRANAPAKSDGSLTPREYKQLVEAMKRLSPEERKRLVKAMKRLSPEERRQLAEVLMRQLGGKGATSQIDK